MKKNIAILVVILAAFSTYWYMLKTKQPPTKNAKVAPITLKKHSDVFNNTINSVVTNYLGIKDAFTEDNIALVKQKTNDFIASLGNIDTAELKKDKALVFETVVTSILDIRSNAESLYKQTDITEMRKDFSNLTDMMYPTFFKAISYEGPKLYLENCPMAFNDDQPGNWISNSEKIVNPYLGKNHPKYKGAMINCGEIKDSIEAE